MSKTRVPPNMPRHTARPVAKVPVAAPMVKPSPKAAMVSPAKGSARPWSRLKLFPVMLAVAVVALGLKVTDLFSGPGRKAPEIAMSAAIAQPKPPTPDPAAAKKDEEEDSEVGGKTDFTRAEVELLQQLSERRAELDKREKDIELRDNLLRATEKRIEEKIAELKKIEGRIDALLKKHDEQEEQRLQSVVKIYETMKPKDAAKVMERLDMPILLDVAERMKTAKMAAIMAEMDTSRARAVTTELATRRRLPTTGG